MPYQQSGQKWGIIMPARGPVDWPALLMPAKVNHPDMLRTERSVTDPVSRCIAAAPGTEPMLCMRAQTRHTDAALQSIGAEARPLPGQN